MVPKHKNVKTTPGFVCHPYRLKMCVFN